jgi:chorismate dehydratase
MTPLRLGAVGYLNARPLVFELERSSLFSLRFDLPSRCAELLHAGEIDLGLIPSIEYTHGGPYAVVPDLAIASRGPVASVAIYTTRPMTEARSIALDTSSRTSVALVKVLCQRAYRIQPVLKPAPPDLSAMLAQADAALIIGDNALFQSGGAVAVEGRTTTIEKIDLGQSWTSLTGLPFVYAFWAGKRGGATARHVEALVAARDRGISNVDAVAAAYYPESPARKKVAAKYLRDNIGYRLGDEERAGLELFYRYAAEVGAAGPSSGLEFF